MKIFLSLFVVVAGLLTGCAGVTFPGPDDSTVTVQHHPAGLPCGFPAGTLTTVRPAPPASPKILNNKP